MRNAGHPAGSWYAATANPFPPQPPLAGEARADVCVVGAGFTGLGAALTLAERGVRVVLLEAATVGSGGSGRNGGQIHVGQRRDQVWLERAVGAADAADLWRLAENARHWLLRTIAERAIDCDLTMGLIHADHRPGQEAANQAHIAHLRERYGYELIEPIGRDALRAELGTDVYFGGVVDRGGGHVHPLNLALGLARAALDEGAVIHEGSRVSAWRRDGGRILVHTDGGRVTCDQLIVTGDGYGDGLSPRIDARVMPISNFVLATEPLGADADLIIRSNAAVSDSRFVVNYFRKTPDGRLLFGGGETYTPWDPPNLAAFVRKRMLRVYPRLHDARITHAWGGRLGITMSRVPYAAELAPGVRAITGYSGQGVMLAPWCGRVLALAALGETGDFDLLARLPTPPFPGGRLLRWPALVAGMSWYALRDRL
ncbi:MAG: NAD(P)/FAD-dependent oxidoreductase [Phenylobacterium sp.]|uniref:NAD(P)/FAD-dependent oxidoreductase n=1 Tax=Phenylobacterium sp. TaxID=1871053 RepID=UPI00391AF17A